MITWRNIDAIDTRGAQLGLSEAGRTFQGATDTLGNLANQQTQLNIRGDEQEQLRRLNQARAQLLGTTSSDALNQYDLNTLGQQFGLDAANTATLQDVFSKQLNEVQSDEYKAAEELRNVAKSDLDLRKGEQDIKLATAGENRAQQLFDGQLTGQKLQNLSSEASLNDTLRNQTNQSYLDASMGTITDAMVKGASEQDIAKMVEGLQLKAPTAEVAQKLHAAVQTRYKDQATLTPTQQRHHEYLVNKINTDTDAELASVEAALASVQSQFPTTPNYAIMENMETGTQWVDYINKHAPDTQWFPGMNTAADAAGTGAHKIVTNAVRDIESNEEIKQKLLDEGILNKTSDKLKIPNQVIMFTLQNMIIDPKDKEIDMSDFETKLAENFYEYMVGRYNAAQVGKAQSAASNAIKTINITRNNRLAKSFDEARDNMLTKTK